MLFLIVIVIILADMPYSPEDRHLLQSSDGNKSSARRSLNICEQTNLANSLSEINQARKDIIIARANAKLRAKRRTTEEMRTNSTHSLNPILEYKGRHRDDSNLSLRSDKTFVREATPQNHQVCHHTDYSLDIDIGDRCAYDLQIIYGLNSVTIRDKEEGTSKFEKVIQLPHGVDPVSLQCRTNEGSVRITGYFKRRHSWIVGRYGVLNVHDDGSSKVTLQVPDHIKAENVATHIVTKHYLVISNSEDNEKASKIEDTLDRTKFLESFELPRDSDLTSIEKRVVGDSNVIIDIPSVSSSYTDRPRAFTY